MGQVLHPRGEGEGLSPWGPRATPPPLGARCRRAGGGPGPGSCEGLAASACGLRLWGSAFCLFTGQDPEACSVGRAGPLASRGPGFRWQMASISRLYTVRLSVPQRSELVVGLVDPSGGARLTPLSPLQPPSDKPALQICPGPQGRSPGSVVFVCSSLVPWVGGCPVVVHGARDVGGWARLPQPRHFIRGLAAPPTVHSCPQPARVGQRGGEPGRPVLRPG